jgi:CRISPR-associated protein Csd2
MDNLIKNRYEFVMLFDVENGNPNGDPDAGNMPRIDPETSLGIVTDVCLKRKIRNFVELTKDGVSGYNILIRNDRSLNSKFTDAYKALNAEREKDGKQLIEMNKKGKNADDVKLAQKYICDNYFDVRAFGAVMSTGNDPCGIVRGPVQINFARSIDRVIIQDITITRQAITKDEDINNRNKSTEMGKKSIIPYGLYRAEGYISAMQGQKTGLTEDDVELIWTAIINMFENDRSSLRGKMCLRKLFVFKHESAIGNAPSHILFDKIVAKKKDTSTVPRNFSDYEIFVDENIPSGVELIEKL